MHAVRLGHQGVELLTTGRLILPMDITVRLECMAIREGKWSLYHVIARIDNLEQEIKRLLTGRSELPKDPDTKAISKLVTETYLYWWK
jgi:hypothetical protein